MYEVDERDRVVPLEGVPQSSTGAALPLIMADDWSVILGYYMASTQPWSGIPRMVDQKESDQAIALIRFERIAHMFGPPNDEAFSGHPLANRGLQPYRAFRIENSSWIRKLERMNRVHVHHKPERFHELQHLVFAFHDSTFECICKEFEVRKEHGSMLDVTPAMISLLFEKQKK